MTIELLCVDGDGVAVPAIPLLATSPLLRTILRDHLPPVFSPLAITLPSVTAEVMKIVGELLTTGTSSCLGKERVEGVNQVFKMLGIEAFLERSQLNNDDDEALALDRKVKVEESEVSDRVEVAFQGKVEDDTSIEDFYLDDKDTNDSDIDVERNDASLKFLNHMVHEPDSDDLICPEQFCGKSFGMRALLDKHVKRMHLGNLKFICDFCPKRFHSKREKESHVNYVHTAKESFDCPECDKKFKSRGDTVKHLKAIHLKLKAFVCKFCDRRFSQNSNMHTHMKKKHSKEWEIQDVVSLKTDPVSLPPESDHMHVKEEEHQSQKDVDPNMEKTIAMDEEKKYENDAEQAYEDGTIMHAANGDGIKEAAVSNPSPQERYNMFCVHMASIMDGTVKKWKCGLCGMKDRNKRNMAEHVENKHMDNSFLYSCRYCSKVLNTYGKLRYHEYSHRTSEKNSL